MEQISNFFMTLHAQVFDPDRLPVAIIALLLVCVIGYFVGAMGGNANPIFWRAVDLLFGKMGGLLDKTDRKAGDLATRGFIITITAVVMGFMLGQFFQTLSTTFPNYKMVDIISLCLILSAGAGWHAVLLLYRALVSKGGVKGAFYAISTTTRTDLTMSDEYTITRVGIGMVAKLFDKGVAAPILWYLIAGLPAAYLYAVLAALSWRFGKEGFSKGFGAPANNLEKLMGAVPNFFAGIILALAGILTPTAGMTRAIIGILPGNKGQAGYFEGGTPITALAYALKVNLGGASQDHDGSAIKRGWAGPDGATARLEASHLKRGLYIVVMGHLLLLVSLLIGFLGHSYGILP